MPSLPTSAPPRARWIGLALAPVMAVVVYLVIPAETANGLSQAGRAVAAVGTLMAILWMTEVLPIPATALLPIVLLPPATGGAIGVRAATAPYGHELVYLLMGGFLIALAMQRWGLHRRIALHTVLLVGTRPTRLVAGFMIASAFLSMWISNTATVVMLLPSALSVIDLVRRELRADQPDSDVNHGSNFAICLLLGTAYAASIGGIGTLIGTPPNAWLAAFLADQYDIEISFVRWMGVGIPLVVVFLPIAWLTLTRVIFPIQIQDLPGGRALIRKELADQGPMSSAEWAVLIIFALTATAWLTRPLLANGTIAGRAILPGLSDAGIAMGAAVLLFAFPIDRRKGVFLLTWQDAVKLPWGVLILFGGGLSLAAAVQSTGVAVYVGGMVSDASELPIVWLVLIVLTTIIFLTELCSNTATTATFVPILGAVAIGLGVSPLLLTVPAAVAASCAFMMPVATPPNAVVFSSGELTIPQMCKAGFWLNLIAIGLITALMYGVAVHVLAIGPI